MNRPKQKKKLALRRDVLKALTPQQASEVAGGASKASIVFPNSTCRYTN